MCFLFSTVALLSPTHHIHVQAHMEEAWVVFLKTLGTRHKMPVVLLSGYQWSHLKQLLYLLQPILRAEIWLLDLYSWGSAGYAQLKPLRGCVVYWMNSIAYTLLHRWTEVLLPSWGHTYLFPQLYISLGLYLYQWFSTWMPCGARRMPCVRI